MNHEKGHDDTTGMTNHHSITRSMIITITTIDDEESDVTDEIGNGDRF